MKYKLKIEDCADASCRTEVVADGFFSDGVLNLVYVYDNADYGLRICRDTVISTRGGSDSVRMEFACGERTECVIKSGNSSGVMDIYTHELKISLTENGCGVHMLYGFGGDGSETISKKITAFALKSAED